MLKKNGKDIVSLLRDGGVEAVYGVSKNKRDLPYAVVRSRPSDNFGADDRVYLKSMNAAIELYSKSKDFDLEEKVEEILDEHEIYWEKSDDIDIEEELMEVIYEI